MMRGLALRPARVSLAACWSLNMMAAAAFLPTMSARARSSSLIARREVIVSLTIKALTATLSTIALVRRVMAISFCRSGKAQNSLHKGESGFIRRYPGPGGGDFCSARALQVEVSSMNATAKPAAQYRSITEGMMRPLYAKQIIAMVKFPSLSSCGRATSIWRLPLHDTWSVVSLLAARHELRFSAVRTITKKADRKGRLSLYASSKTPLSTSYGQVALRHLITQVLPFRCIVLTVFFLNDGNSHALGKFLFYYRTLEYL